MKAVLLPPKLTYFASTQDPLRVACLVLQEINQSPRWTQKPIFECWAIRAWANPNPAKPASYSLTLFVLKKLRYFKKKKKKKPWSTFLKKKLGTSVFEPLYFIELVKIKLRVQCSVIHHGVQNLLLLDFFLLDFSKVQEK